MGGWVFHLRTFSGNLREDLVFFGLVVGLPMHQVKVSHTAGLSFVADNLVRL